MTRADATFVATALAAAIGHPAEVWEHIGGESPKGKVLPQSRFVVRDSHRPAPRWCWQKALIVALDGASHVPTTPEELATTVVERIEAMPAGWGRRMAVARSLVEGVAPADVALEVVALNLATSKGRTKARALLAAAIRARDRAPA